MNFIKQFLFESPFGAYGGVLLLAAQIALAIHVIRSGRPYWWLWLILVFPGIGCIAYLVVEVLPEVRYQRGTSLTALFKTRGQRMRELRALLEETDTVDTRMALAAELSAEKRFSEAYEVLAECLRGPLNDEPHMLLALARVQLEMGKGCEALEILSKVQPGNDKWMGMKLSLLQGWGLQLTGRTAEGEALLRSVADVLPSDEARYRLGVLLQHDGRAGEARQAFEEIIRKFRKAGPAWRRAERPWFKLAKARLGEIVAPKGVK